MPDLVVIGAGSFNDPSRYRPKMISWSAAAQPRDHIDPTLPAFAGMPPT